MSIGVSVFIFINAIKTLSEALNLFLEKTPADIDIDEIKNHISHIEGVEDVHHIHVWSLDGSKNYATMHIVTNSEHQEIKKLVREELKEHGICHATLELESNNEYCPQQKSHVEHTAPSHHHHHH